MKKVLVLVLVLVIGALALLPVAQAAPARTARVAVTDLAPFTVHGSGFLPSERVTVTVYGKQRVVRRALANARGQFTASFAALNLERCNSYVVRAVGLRGSTAAKKVTPECAAPGPNDELPMYPVDPQPKRP